MTLECLESVVAAVSVVCGCGDPENEHLRVQGGGRLVPMSG